MLKLIHVGSRRSGKMPSNNETEYFPCVGGIVSDDGNGYYGSEAVLNVWEGDGKGAVLEVCAEDQAIVLQLDGVDVARLLAILQDLCRPEWMAQYLAEDERETAEIFAMFEKAREARS